MNRNTNFNPLTKNAMRQMFMIDTSEKKPTNVDLKVQVLNIRKNDNGTKGKPQNSTPQSEIYTASLSDGDYKYTGFIISRDLSSNMIEEGDVIRILCVSSAVLNMQKSRVFVVRKYEMLEKLPLIGQPELIKDTEDSKERFPPLKDTNHRGYYDEEESKNRGASYNGGKHVQVGYQAGGNNNGSVSNQRPLNPNLNMNQSNVPQGNKFYSLIPHLTTFTKDINLLIRVVKKSEMKNWSGGQNKQTGNLFSFTMIDQEGNEMQATAFNKVCDKYFNEIQEDGVYEINGGYVRLNDKKYSNVKCEYKMVLDDNTRITRREDDGSIQHMSFHPVKLEELITLSQGNVIDTLAYVIEAHEKQKINTKMGESTLKKLLIGDTSGVKCEFTLWKAYADLEFHPGQILLIKSAKVGEYNGKNLGSIDDTVITIDPNCEEANVLRNFVNEFNDWKSLSSSVGVGENNQSIGTKDIVYIKEALEQLDLLSDDKITVCPFKATVCTINHSEKNFYPGCPDNKCKKKLTKESYDWTCLTCQKTIPKPYYYYTISIRIKDASAEFWVDVFGQIADKLFNMPCEEYKDLVINNDEVRLREITSSLEFRTFYFLGKPKNQLYNNVAKKKLNIYRIEALDLKQDSRRMLKNLEFALKR